MTENEKAATFIGWRPERCKGGYTINGAGPWTCSEGHSGVGWESAADHSAPAPDMTDPRNYMKALESIEALEVIFQIYDGLNVSIFKKKYRERVGDPPDAYGFDEHEWGDAVVMALAALYDAEHPKESEKSADA